MQAYIYLYIVWFIPDWVNEFLSYGYHSQHLIIKWKETICKIIYAVSSKFIKNVGYFMYRFWLVMFMVWESEAQVLISVNDTCYSMTPLYREIFLSLNYLRTTFASDNESIKIH